MKSNQKEILISNDLNLSGARVSVKVIIFFTVVECCIEISGVRFWSKTTMLAFQFSHHFRGSEGGDFYCIGNLNLTEILFENC